LKKTSKWQQIVNIICGRFNTKLKTNTDILTTKSMLCTAPHIGNN